MKQENLAIDCPTCGKVVQYCEQGSNPFFPFCSKRCKLLDLGKWLAEDHRIVEALPDRLEDGGEDEQRGGERG